MTDLEPTNLPDPPAPTPAPAPVEVKPSLHPALTGLAGMVVGSILLGKKAGLLAGLVGAGAKVLLEQHRPQAAPPASPDPKPEPQLEAAPEAASVIPPVEAEPAPSVISDLVSAPVLENYQPPVVPKPEPEVQSEISQPPAPTEAKAEPTEPNEEPKETEPTSGLTGALLATGALSMAGAALMARQEAAPEKSTSAPEAESEPPMPVADSLNEPPEVIAVLAPVEEEIVAPSSLQEEIEPQVMAEVPVSKSAEPILDQEAIELARAALTPLAEEVPTQTMTPLVDNLPLAAQEVSMPEPVVATVESSVKPAAEIPDAQEDRILEEALSHKEEFTNYTQTVPDPLLPAPPAPIAPISNMVETAVVAESAEPLAEPPTALEAFVQWPEASTQDTEPEQTAFQAFVANMFQEAAQSTTATPEPAAPHFTTLADMASVLHTEPTALQSPEETASNEESADSLLERFSALTQPAAPANVPFEIPAPPIPEIPVLAPEVPAPVVPAPVTPEAQPPVAELTPEDIWRLAAAESLTLDTTFPPIDPEPIPAVLAIAANPAIPDVSEPAIPQAEAPLPQVAPLQSMEPSAELPHAPVISLEAVPHLPPALEQPQHAAATSMEVLPEVKPETPLASPAGMAPFVELFGTKPTADAAQVFAKVPTEPLLSPFAQKRMSLLTPEEEQSLAQPRSTPPTEPISRPAETAPSMHFSPPVPIILPKPKSRLKQWITALLVGALGGVGYAKRDILLTQWNQWTQGAKETSNPSRSKATAPSAPAPTEPAVAVPVPAPVPVVAKPAPVPPVQPEPAPAPPEPPAMEPKPAVPEIRPAVDPPPTAAPIVNEEPKPLPAPPPPSATDPEQVAQQQAEAAIKNFLNLSTVPEILDHVLNRERIESEVHKYYSANPPQPTPFTDLILDSTARVADANVKAFLYRVRSKDRPDGFPICLEETPAGYKVEWNAFTQCRDRAAAQFWKGSGQESASLYVVLKRSHYFGEDMTNLEEFDCFRINSPNPDEEPVYAFARKDSTFSRKFRNQIAWDANYFAVAVFTHAKNSQGAVHHEIIDIERFNWRGAK